ncbi:MAG: reductive dehalogenase [bacterium]
MSEYPTYEVVGPFLRVDERDTVFARACLIPGTPEERAYHSAHPELKQIDEKMGRFYRRDANPYFESVFGPVAALAFPDIVDGPISEKILSKPEGEFTCLTKKTAERLGADLVGIGLLNEAWVYSHRGRHPYFERHKPNPPLFKGIPSGYSGLVWGDTIDIKHKFVVAMAFAQDHGLLGNGVSDLADFEVGRAYARSALVSVQLAGFIRGLGYPARAHHLRNYGIMVVPAAVDSGLGELGRCGYLVTRRFGANTRIACVTTDLPLIPDKPVDLGIQDFCNKCLKCARACPAAAIPEGEKVVVRGVRKWEISGEKCFLYWGTTGHSCAICQVVCPWSKPDTFLHTAVSGLAVNVPPSRRVLIWIDHMLFPAK